MGTKPRVADALASKQRSEERAWEFLRTSIADAQCEGVFYVCCYRRNVSDSMLRELRDAGYNVRTIRGFAYKIEWGEVRPRSCIIL